MALTKITTSAVADDIGLGGNPTTSTQTAGDSTTRIATTAFVSTAVANLVDSSPATLNTLNELAAAIGDDATFSSTITTSIATKLPLAGGALTGAVTTNSTFDGVDIAARDAVLTSTTTTAGAALPKAGGTMTGGLSGTTGTFSGAVTANGGVVVDNFTLDGTTLALSSGDFTLDVAGYINLDADGGTISMGDAGTTSFSFIQGTNSEIDVPRGNLTLDVAGDIILDADGGDILLKDAGTHWASVYTNGTNTYIQNMVNSGDIYLSGKDGSGNGVNALTLDMSAAGYATFNDGVKADGVELTNAGGAAGGTTPKLYSASSGTLGISANGAERIVIDGPNGRTKIVHDLWCNANVGIGTSSPSSELTIGADTPQIDLLKASSADVLANIRAETDAGTGGKLVFQTKRNGNTALDRMTIDDDGNVGIGYTSPAGYGKFLVQGTGNLITANASSGAATFQLYEAGQGRFGITTLDGSAGAKFTLAGVEKMRIDSSGNVGIGTAAPDSNLHIKSTADVKLTLETDEDSDCWINFSGATSEASIGYEPAANELRFANAVDGVTSNVRMTITSDGRIGFGESAGNVGHQDVEGKMDLRMDMSGVDWTHNDWASVWDNMGIPGTYFNKSVLHLDTNRFGGSTGGIVGIAFSPGWQGHQNWGIYSHNRSGGSRSQGDLSFVNQLNDSNTPLERMRLTANGNVGISTSNPQKTLDVQGTFAISNNANSYWDFDRDDSDGSLKIADTGTERMRIDASGRVSIGRSSNVTAKCLELQPPAQISDFGSYILNIGGDEADDAVGTKSGIGFGYTSTARPAAPATIGYETKSTSGGTYGDLYFATRATYGTEQPTERMRIDSSGNLLVGNTVANPASGFSTQRGFGYTNSTGKVEIATTANDAVMEIGKNNANDGSLIVFRKQGTTVGSISVLGTNNLTICGTQANHCGLSFATNAILPATQGATNTGIVDLGASSEKFKDLYLSGTAYAPLLVTNDIKATGSGGISIQTDEGTKRLEITDSGNVGIGTSSPDNKLHVYKGASGHSWSFDGGDGFILENSDSVSINIATPSSNSANILFSDADARGQGRIVYDHGSDYMGFYTAGVTNEAMRIDSSSNVLINCTSAEAYPGATFSKVGSTGTTLCSNTISSGHEFQTFRYYNGQNGAISLSGTSGVTYATSSDYRLKENVVPMTGSIDRVKALKPSRFNFISESDRTVDGFLAHEAQEIVPECVTGTKDAMKDEEYEVSASIPEVRDEDDNITTEAVEAVMGTRSVPDYQGIDQAKLVPLLVAALQEAIARIEILEAGV